MGDVEEGFGRLGRRPTPAGLHAVRILAKRVRYATEAVAPAAGNQAMKFAEHATRIQDALGELNDAAAVGAWLTAMAERLDGPAAFTAGRMTQQLVVEARTHDKRWRAARKSMTKHAMWCS